MQSLLLLTLASLAAGGTIKLTGLEYGFCAGAEEPLNFKSFNIAPYPLVLQPGQDLSVSLIVELLEVVPEGAKVKLDIIKKGTIINIPIPCLAIGDLHIGSCEYDGQHLLDEFADRFCPTYVPDGQACQLPLNPGQYGGSTTLTIPEIPDIILSVLSAGIFEVKVHAIRPDGSEETCIFAKVELAE